jgi:hypothetical protein
MNPMSELLYEWCLSHFSLARFVRVLIRSAVTGERPL